MTQNYLLVPPVISIPVIVISFTFLTLITSTGNIQAENKAQKFFFRQDKLQIETKTQFQTKTLTKKQPIPFKTIHQKDPNLEWGKVVTTQAGKPGENLIITEQLFWKGEKIGTRIYTRKIFEPQTKINLIGTKLTPGEINTPNGTLSYKGKVKMYATSYDKNCPGCSGTTATGAKLTYGIAAVDPNFIPLGSKIYVEGYGQALAADTGGGIKGAKIDLAFDDVRSGFWSARFTDVYLLE